MATGNNLNVKFNGDASGVKKASQEARNSIKQFEKTSTGALDAIAGAFGINTNQVRQYQQALQGAITKFTGLGAGGSAAMSGIAKAATGAAAGIAGLGIAAATLAFKELNSEAEAFRGTVEGINMTLAQNAYRDTFTQALRDANGAGAKWAQFTEQVKNGFTYAKGTVVNWMFGGTKEDRDRALAAGERAYVLQQRLNILRARERDLRKDVAEYDVQIAQQQERFRDTSLSSVERQNALEEATRLINEKYEKQNALKSQQLEITKELNSLATSSEATINAEVDMEVALINLNKQRQTELNALVRQRNSITNAAAKETKEMEKQRDLMKEMGQLSALSGISSSATTSITGGLDMSGFGFLDEVNEKARLFADQMMQINEQVSNFLSNLTSDAISSFSTSIGELAADLVNGSNAWSTFGNAALSTIGDMAMSVGKMAIATGVATLGIKTALKSLNGYVAIAAGAALVALGAAVKTGLSNIASGGSASASVATSGYSGSGASTSASNIQETMTINVTGTLQADGSRLVAVLNNEARRKNYVG